MLIHQATFFNILGKLGVLVKSVKTNQTTFLTAMTDTTNGIVAQLNNESDIQALIGSSYIGTLGGVEGPSRLAQSVAPVVLNRKIFRDSPLLNQTLTQANTDASIQQTLLEMKAAGASVLAMTVTAAPQTPYPYFIGRSNATIVTSVRRPVDGVVLENAFAEQITVTCTQDSFTGGASPNNETFSVTGAGAETDIFAFDWPLGSNCSTSLNAIDGNSSNNSGNILNNSGFSSFNGNVPNSWTITQGAANIFRENSLVFGGTSSLRIQGDGTTLVSLKQAFGSSAGTGSTLSPQTQYGFNLWLRRDGIVPGAGILYIDLVDQNGNVLLDLAGNANQFYVDLTQLTVFYAPYGLAFRTPVILPSQLFLRLHLTTPLTNGRSIYLADLSLGVMSQLYTGGPFVSVHAGSIPAETGDYMYLSTSNSRGIGGTLSTFQVLFWQLFNQSSVVNEWILPSSATPTINDAALIS